MVGEGGRRRTRDESRAQRKKRNGYKIRESRIRRNKKQKTNKQNLLYRRSNDRKKPQLFIRRGRLSGQRELQPRICKVVLERGLSAVLVATDRPLCRPLTSSSALIQPQNELKWTNRRLTPCFKT